MKDSKKKNQIENITESDLKHDSILSRLLKVLISSANSKV